jgi:agmatinase
MNMKQQSTNTTPVEDKGLSRRAFLQASLFGGAAAVTGGLPAIAAAEGAHGIPAAFARQDVSAFTNIEVLTQLEQALPFAGIPTFMKLPYSRDLDALRAAEIVVMGVPFDGGTSNRAGTRFGPRVIREQSLYAGVFQPLYPWADELTGRNILDFGDVVSIPGTGAVELMLEMTEYAASIFFEAGVRLLTLGGDHTLPYGPVRAAAKQYGQVALIHIDSHQDSYDGGELMGFPFINHGTFATGLANEGHIDLSKSSQVYIRTNQPATPGGGYNIVYANDALAMGPERLAEAVRERAGDAPVYLTLDIDALDPAFAPGNGSPVAGGPSTAEMRRFLRGLDGLNIVAADLVEVNPLYDPTGITAIAAATLAADMLYLMAHAGD